MAAHTLTHPKAIVEPIHPKAMPVILTTDEERDAECARRGMKLCEHRCRMMS
jgi:hypothetical protein